MKSFSRETQKEFFSILLGKKVGKSFRGQLAFSKQQPEADLDPLVVVFGISGMGERSTNPTTRSLLWTSTTANCTR